MSGLLPKQLVISEIIFPVYRISKGQKLVIEGSRVFAQDKKEEKHLIVDLSYPGTTIGEKRIHSTIQGDDLYKLNKCIYSLANMIKGDSNVIYIDNRCNIFNYVKSVVSRLIYVKLSKVLCSNENGTYISVEGMRNLIRADRLPEIGENWVALASIGNGYLFMGYSPRAEEPSTVKI